MQSQTGYGRGTSSSSKGSLTLDIKSVNGKFLDITIKAPRFITPFEEKIKKEISKVATRGTIEVRINTSLENKSLPKANFALAAEYLALSKTMSKQLGVKNDIKTSRLLSMPEVLSTQEMELQDEEVWNLVEPALTAALDQFKTFKTTEGKAMQTDLSNWCSAIQTQLEEVKQRVPNMLAENQAKMQQRIQELLGNIEVDQAKLANEIAFFVDRVDINEEIKRLQSHINQFNQLLLQETPGKQIEFLSQEMTREINTMGSKSNDIEITKCVLQMKNANEKIKEQMRNIE